MELVGPGPRPHEAWRILRVRGGWLRFSPEHMRLDAHCGQHGMACKFDKVLSKCFVGNQLAWLAKRCSGKADHDAYKAEVGKIENKPSRESFRAEFVALAETSGGNPKDVLDAEFAASGRREEPDIVRK